MKKTLALVLTVIMVAVSIPTMGLVQASPNESWPTVFTPYTYSDGVTIYDPGADEHPIDVDITSGVDRGTGNLPSVYFASDAANFFVRLRLKGDPYDSKGGFLSSVWLVQLAVGGVHKATIGLDGKSPSVDFVYTASADGTIIHSVYRTPTPGGSSVPGTRIVPAENGHYFLDFQVPISEITAVAPEITANTSIQLFYGTSKAANLSVINKEWMNTRTNNGSGTDFSGLAQITLNSQPPTVSIDGGASKVYTSPFVMTGSSSVASGTISLVINDGTPAQVQINDKSWSYPLPVAITTKNGTYKAVATLNGTAAKAEQNIVITSNSDTDLLSIDGGPFASTGVASLALTGKYFTTANRKNYSVNVYVSKIINGVAGSESPYDTSTTEGIWTTKTQVNLALKGPISDGDKFNIRAVWVENGSGTIFAAANQELTYRQGVAISPISVAINSIPATGNSQPAISGTSSNADNVELQIDGNTVEIATATSGSWSVNALERPLSAGTHSVRAVASNSTGNTATASTTYTVSQTSITIDNGSTVILNDNLPTIRGNTNAANGTAITVTVGSGSYSTTAQNGRWAITVSPALADGAYTVTATVGSASATQQLTIETSTLVTIGAPVEGATTTERQPIISGTAETGATVDLRVSKVVSGSGNEIAIVQSLTANGGNWSYTPTSPLAYADYIITTTAADLYGNEATDTHTFTVTAAPSLTHDVAGNAKTFSALTAGYAGGARETLTVTVASTGTNNNVKAALSGANAESFTLTENISTLTNGQTGTFTVVPNNGLAAGTYNATVTITSDEFPAGVTFTVTQVVNDAPSLTHDVAGNAKTFSALTAGYAGGARETLTVTVASTGTNNNVKAALSGANAESFTLTENISTLTNGQTGTFTVVPNNGLAAGTYNATVTITSDEFPAGAAFTVTQVVNAAPTYTVSVSQVDDFGSKTLGYASVAEQTGTITRTGSGDITGLDATLSGTNAGSFALGALGATSLTATAPSTTFTIKPNDGLSVGTYTATVTITGDNGISKSFDVSFTVTAAPTYSVSVSQVDDFGSQTVGYASVPAQTVTITRAGTGDITGLDATMSGTDAGSFTLANLAALRVATLTASSSSTNFTIKPIDGLGVGTYAATVTITGDNGISKSFDLSFAVTAAPTYTVSVSQVNNFGSKTVGYASVDAQTVTITRTGSGDISGLATALSGTNAGSFTLGALGSTSLTAANQSTSFTVKPSDGLAVGTYAATVTITGDHSISKSFDLSFAVTAAPTYTVSVSQMNNFGSQTVDYDPVDAQTVTITRTGTGDISGLATALSGTNADSFILGALGATGLTAAYQSTSFTVKPNDGLAVGTYAATVTITGDNGISKSFDLSFAVTAAPTYTVSVSQVSNFGSKTVDYDPVDAQTVTVTRTGSGDISGLATALSGTNAGSFTLGALGSTGLTAAYQSTSFTVKPNDGLAVGTYAATVTITGDNGISKSFDLSFAVTAAPTYTVSVSQVNNFGSKTVGYASVDAQTVTVTRTGSGDISGLATALSGTNAGSFTLGALGSTSLTATAPSTTFTIKPNDGLAVGTYAATVTITGDNGISETINLAFTVTRASNGGGGSSTTAPPSAGGTTQPPTNNLPPEVNVKLVTTSPSNNQQSGNLSSVTSRIGTETQLAATLIMPDGRPVSLPVRQVGGLNELRLQPLPPGDYRLVVQTIAPDGTPLAGNTATLRVTKDGTMSLQTGLIDPFGAVIDPLTGQPLAGVTLSLYWADTANNRSQGRTSDTLVNLPELPNLLPNKNHNPQVTGPDGQYAWMVFPNSDYYFTAQKQGFDIFDSRHDPRNEQYGENSYIKDGVIHVGDTIVQVNFGLKQTVLRSGEHQPYMYGFPDGEFKPEEGITRGQMAAILARVFPMPAPLQAKPQPAFPDVTNAHWAAQAIRLVSQNGVMVGYPDGEFKPEQKLTRAEIVATLMRLVSPTSKPSTDTVKFSDIKQHWAETVILKAQNAGILGGDPDGRYRPDDPVARAEAVSIINRILDRHPWIVAVSPRWPDVKQINWAYRDIMEASVPHSYDQLVSNLEVWNSREATAKE